jgi:hypothetical protein
MFSNFQVEYGRDKDGNVTLLRVPVRYGDSSRQVQTILQNNSATNMPAAPLMSFYISGLEYARDRVQEPQFVGKVQVRQREYNSASETYDTVQGNAFTVERRMPVPYNLNLTLDIWTSNTNQKLQLIEQIAPLFNPSMEIQSTDNYLDWTSLSIVELNSVTWSSRTIPIGTDNPIDVASMQFTTPIWLTLPAKVTKMGVIHRIIAGIHDDNLDAFDALSNDDLLLGTRMKVTPHGYQLLLIGNQLQLLDGNAIEDPNNNSFDTISFQKSILLWHAITEEYGTVENGISQVRLSNGINDSEIIGTIAFHPTDDNIMLFTIDSDTLPENTLNAVDAIVNPLRSGPGILSGTTTFPIASPGQRYLLTESTGELNVPASDVVNAWKGTDGTQLIANTNDIIEYDGTSWNIAFDAGITTTVEHITNITTTIQYKWTGSEWLRSYEGLYAGGDWSLVL